MASAKAWYWLGLGVLAISFMTSGAGRSLSRQAASYVACMRARVLPYVGAVEMSFGHTETGYRHLQMASEQNRGRLEMERARIEAAQAMLQDQRMQEELRRAQELLSNRKLMQSAVLVDHVSLPPDAVVAPRIEVTDGAGRILVCPQRGVRTAMPAVHVEVAPRQEPI